jgi:phospholipase C
MPVQEPGTRPSRSLPYTFYINTTWQTNNLLMFIHNTGEGGAAFQLYNLLIPALAPRKYTVEAGKSIQDNLFVDS